MRPARDVRRALAVVGVLILSGCGIFDPCDFGAQTDDLMDVRWQLILVNGQSRPAAGWALPTGGDRLTFGALHFQTTKLNGGSCRDAEGKSEGRVVAIYNLVNSAGQEKPSKSYAGTFEYDHIDGVVTLRAFGRSLTGPRTGIDFEVVPNIPFLGSYVLTFRKTG